MRRVALVATVDGSRYLQQLCKHWSHKFDVTYDTTNGELRFSPTIRCSFVADAETLRIVLDAENAEDLPRMESVVADHLQRFAVREALAIVWEDELLA